jgi:ketosteroid isomerase-like protein
MTIPDAIARYYESSADGDIEAILACFAPDAQVIDQDQTFIGPTGIRAWREAVSSAFTYTTELTSVEDLGAEWVVGTHLVGDFPGGVVDLTNKFTVVDDVITRLVI